MSWSYKFTYTNLFFLKRNPALSYTWVARKPISVRILALHQQKVLFCPVLYQGLQDKKAGCSICQRGNNWPQVFQHKSNILQAVSCCCFFPLGCLEIFSVIIHHWQLLSLSGCVINRHKQCCRNRADYAKPSRMNFEPKYLLAQLCQLQPQQKLLPFFTKILYTSLKVPEAPGSFHTSRVWNYHLCFVNHKCTPKQYLIWEFFGH